MDEKNGRIINFILLTYAVSWILWLPGLLDSYVTGVPDILLFIGGAGSLGPAAAALILTVKRKGRKSVGRFFGNAWNWKFKKIWLLPALLIAPVLTSSALLIRTAVDRGTYETDLSLIMMPLGILIILFTGGPLEEFGWRGYALPLLLKRFDPLPASLILGLLHGLWHLPLHFISGTVQAEIPVLEFIAVTTVGAVFYTWIYIRTNGSLTLMILHHWIGNISAAVFLYWTTTAGRWIFFVLQMIPAAIVGAILLKIKKNKDFTGIGEAV